MTYEKDTGEIYDADLELNSSDYPFTTTDTMVEYDLQSIITHEAGHFLGMSHSVVPDATMFPSVMPGNTGLRNLTPDDVSGICAIYPPGAPIPSSCDATPRHGFSAECAANQPDVVADQDSSTSSCALRDGETQGGLGSVAFLGLLGLAARIRERRRRR